VSHSCSFARWWLSAATDQQALAVQEGQDPLGQVPGVQLPQVHGVDRLALLRVEARRVGRDAGAVEAGDQLLHGEDLLVAAERPAEQRQVVEQALGQVAGALG
jgi:hypothetical protein